MGLPFTHNELYASDSDLCHRLMAYYDEFNQMPAFNSLFIGNFCVIETTRQLLDVARLRMQWWGADPDKPMPDDRKDDDQQSRQNGQIAAGSAGSSKRSADCQQQ